MNRFVVLFVAVALCASVNSAWAADGDEQVVTASRPATSPTTVLSAAAASASPTVAADSVQPLPLQDGVPAYDATNPLRPHMDLSLIHGSAGVSIGTGGYRSVYATAVMPVANDGVLGIAVRQTDYGKNGAVYDYGGYGYGRYGRGYGAAQRGGKSTSVAVALDMGDGESSTTPAGCAPGFRDGDGRYVEPVWVTQLHDHRKCDVTETSTQGQ